MKYFYWIFFISCFCSLFPFSEDSFKAFIEEETKNFLKKNNGAGLALCALKHLADSDKLFEKTHCLGQARRSRGIAMTESTLFRLGQLSKLHLTLLLLKSENQGKISLEKSIVDLLPKSFSFPHYHQQYPTVLEIGCEHGSLPSLPTIPMRFQAASEVDIKNYFKSYKLAKAPGKQYLPSDLGFGVLGVALSHIWRRPIEEILKNEVFGAFDLNQTYYSVPLAMLCKCAIGHQGLSEIDQTRYDRDGSFFKASRGLSSSIEDMKKLLKIFLKEEKTDQVMILKRMYKHEYSFNDHSLKKISLGWQIAPLSSNNQLNVYFQSCIYEGFSHFIAFIPDARTGVVILTNNDYSTQEFGFKILREMIK